VCPLHYYPAIRKLTLELGIEGRQRHRWQKIHGAALGKGNTLPRAASREKVGLGPWCTKEPGESIVQCPSNPLPRPYAPQQDLTRFFSPLTSIIYSVKQDPSYVPQRLSGPFPWAIRERRLCSGHAASNPTSASPPLKIEHGFCSLVGAATQNERGTRLFSSHPPSPFLLSSSLPRVRGRVLLHRKQRCKRPPTSTSSCLWMWKMLVSSLRSGKTFNAGEPASRGGDQGRTAEFRLPPITAVGVNQDGTTDL